MERLHIKQAIVVEGRYDIGALKRVTDAMIIETKGFGIFSDREKIALLRRLADERGLIILTDSDASGFVIRNHLRGALPKDRVGHAYIPDVKGKERRKVLPSKEGLLGVEGMEDRVLADALIRAGAVCAEPEKRDPITKARLYADGLSGRKDSAERRERLLKLAGLPARMTANALLEALNIFYSLEDYEKLIETLDFQALT